MMTLTDKLPGKKVKQEKKFYKFLKIEKKISKFFGIFFGRWCHSVGVLHYMLCVLS